MLPPLSALIQGMLKGEALSQAYASADIFVMPSESETLGFVVLEAMASGLPVVSVAAGGLTDVITQPGITGFLYPSGDLQVMHWLSAGLRDMGGGARAMARVMGGGVRGMGLGVMGHGWWAMTCPPASYCTGLALCGGLDVHRCGGCRGAQK